MFDAGKQFAQQCLSFLQRSIADVLSAVLQQVVGDETHRTLPFQHRSNRLATKPPLQLVESQRRRFALAPADHLSVQHRTMGQCSADSDEFRKAVVHQLLTTAPQINPTAAMDQLPADAIPLPLHLPVRWSAFLQPLRIKRTGKKEWIGRSAGAAFFRLFRSGELQESLRRRFESTHQPLHHQVLVQCGGLRHGPADQPR